MAPKKAKKDTNPLIKPHKIKIKSKINCDTVANVGALHLSQTTALRPFDAVVVPDTSKTNQNKLENEIKPLVSVDVHRNR